MIPHVRLFYTLHNLGLCDRKTANEEYFYAYTFIHGLLRTLWRLGIVDDNLDGYQLFSNMYYNRERPWK